MANAFRLLDVVPNAELRGYYNAADVGVWPLQCSISQLEASACGVPSLISDRGGAPERISFGNGLTYHESDVQDLSDKMVIFLSKEKRAVFSEKAILYSKTLDWGNLAETFLRV
jgi:glycosyltransferase involved in cell wall biosynthesis